MIMKNLILFLVLCLELFLASSFFEIFTFYGSSPALILITLMIYAMFYKKEETLIMALVIGILSDFLYGACFGINTIVYGGIVLVITHVVRFFNHQSLLSAVFFLLGTLITFHTLTYLLLLIFGKAIPFMIYLRQINIQYIIINLFIMFLIRLGFFKLMKNNSEYSNYPK